MRTTPSTSQNSTEESSWPLIRLVSPTGIRKNSTIASTSATTTVPAHTAAGISSRLAPRSSSGRQLRVGGDPERAKADRHRPAERDHAADDRQAQHAVAPQRRVEREGRTSISPSAASSGERSPPAAARRVGLRTATAQLETPRIITPSSTACPPTGASRWALSSPSSSTSAAPARSAAAGGARRRASAARVARDGSPASRRPDARTSAYCADRACAECRRPLATRRWKRSTRPPVSISFCLPV